MADEHGNSGIYITRIDPPAIGWPVAFYCPICRETTFLLSRWDVKPKNADYHKLNSMCASAEFAARHNLKILSIECLESNPFTLATK